MQAPPTAFIAQAQPALVAPGGTLPTAALFAAIAFG